MDLPQGYHREVIETKENDLDIDFSEESLERTVSVLPLKPGGSNFKTHVLVRNENKMMYKPSYGAAIFSSLFLTVGLGLLFFGIRELILSQQEHTPNLVLFLVGIVSTIVSIVLFYISYQPVGFDKGNGYYYKGFGNPQVKKNSRLFKKIALKDLAALQIIGESVSGSKSRYNSFELNLVLKNGTRTNVIDHGNLKSIINDTEELSSFLELPIWHAKTGNY